MPRIRCRHATEDRRGKRFQVVGHALGACERADDVDRAQQQMPAGAPAVARVEFIIRDGEIDATLVDLAGGQRQPQAQPRGRGQSAQAAGEIRQPHLAADRQPALDDDRHPGVGQATTCPGLVLCGVEIVAVPEGAGDDVEERVADRLLKRDVAVDRGNNLLGRGRRRIRRVTRWPEAPADRLAAARGVAPGMSRCGSGTYSPCAPPGNSGVLPLKLPTMAL